MIDTFVFVKLLYKWGQSTYIAVMRNLTPFLNPAFNVASHLDKVVLKSLSVHSFDAVIRLKPCCFLPAVKGFGIENKSEIDVFLGTLLLFR